MDVTHDPELAQSVETVLMQVADSRTFTLSPDPMVAGAPQHFQAAALNVAAAGYLDLIDRGDDSEGRQLALLGIDPADPRPLSVWAEPCWEVCPTEALLLATLSMRMIVNRVSETHPSTDLRSLVRSALDPIAERLGVGG